MESNQPVILFSQHQPPGTSYNQDKDRSLLPADYID